MLGDAGDGGRRPTLHCEGTAAVTCDVEGGEKIAEMPSAVLVRARGPTRWSCDGAQRLADGGDLKRTAANVFQAEPAMMSSRASVGNASLRLSGRPLGTDPGDRARCWHRLRWGCSPHSRCLPPVCSKQSAVLPPHTTAPPPPSPSLAILTKPNRYLIHRHTTEFTTPETAWHTVIGTPGAKRILDHRRIILIHHANAFSGIRNTPLDRSTLHGKPAVRFNG